MNEAILYEKLADRSVICHLCAHHCKVRPGRMGVCAVRENRAGTLYTWVYDRVAAQSVDPVEKKPLFHFLPGTRTYSIATVGCNFHCRYCQTWDLSQTPKVRRRHVVGTKTTPEMVVAGARAQGCASIAYTYSEPTMFLELALDVAKLAREAGLANVFVTNGYLSPESLALVCSHMDAANVDMKGFDEKTHRAAYGANVKPVMDCITRMHEAGVWVEVTTPIVPGLNDDDVELKAIASFLRSVDSSIPWHLAPFAPAYLMADRSPADPAMIERAWRIGKEAGLEFVYAPGSGESTHNATQCPGCRSTVIEREGFVPSRIALDHGKCPTCGAALVGVWQRLPEAVPAAS